MSTNYTQDADFIKDIIPKSLLEDAIAWIAKNMNPTDVFSQKELEEWATKEGYVMPED